MVQKILKAKNLGEAEDHYKALFVYCGPAGLPPLRESANDGIALQAAWQEVALSTHTSKAGHPNREKLVWFLGFLEGRIRIRPPDWWRQALLASKFNSGGSVFVLNVNKHQRYKKTGLDDMMSPPGTTVKRKDASFVLQVGEQSASISDYIVLNRQRANRLSAAITARRCYLAVHDDLGFAYPLFCTDRASAQTFWKAEVWDVFWLRGGLSWLSDPSVNDRAVTVVEQDGRVVVFGAGVSGLNVEGFRANNGTNLFRFSSSCGVDCGPGSKTQAPLLRSKSR
jgi:hypothetical protein